MKNKNAKDRWKRTKVLIIDEISMISCDLFDKIEYIARKVRQTDEPFGGIQVIICGDFCKLLF
jgi:ATP-dependent DNA helicase PIF1